MPDESVGNTTVAAEPGPGPSDVPDTIGTTLPREHVTADGRIFVAWDEGDHLAPTVQAREMSIPTLSGATVEVSVPTGMEIAVDEALGGRTITLSTEQGDVQWRSTRRGWGLMAVTAGGGTAATLVELVEVGDALLAQYELDQSIDTTGPEHFTLWQGATAEMVSFDYDSLEVARKDVESFELDESSGHLVLRAPTLTVVDEYVGGGLFPVSGGYVCREVASVVVSPSLSSDTAPSSVEGQWGEFLSFESGFDWGFVFRSATAVATVEGHNCDGPAPVSFLVELEDELFEHLRVEWDE